ncbi:MAG: Ig-like domain-containing protein, partial [Myxococcota bacterium]
MTRPWHLSPVLIPFLVLSACSCDDTEPEQATVDATLSTIEADSPVSIHGDTFSLVTVTVLDADGSPIPGVEIELAGSREGQDLITQPSSLTDEEGIAEGRVSSTVAGTTTISAIAGGIELEAGAEIEFVDEQDCPDDQVWCGEETGCVTLGTTEHCSTCDDACQAPDNAEASCEGSCTWSCVDGWASCDGDDETGCETELGTLENCLDCGDACEEYANSTAVCDEDGCGLVCDEGWGSCDGELETGCETELEGGECPPKDCPEGQVDCGTAGCVELGTEEHCLECHDECEAPANAVGVCGFDGCTFVCLQGFGDCDGDASNGCEEELDGEGLCPSGCPPGEEDCGGGCVPLDTVDHCGDCQTSCEAPANSTAVCLPTGCSFECDDGFGDCDGDASNGCEQSLDDDLHCGACGAACENPPNATAFCSDGETGTCGYECEEGFADCDSDPANGCETDLSAATCCDFESFITLSSPCLTAEAGGVTVAHVEVRDITGQRVPGASVTLDAGSLQVLDQVTESASQPGVYYARIATPEQPGDYQIAASATYEGEWVCGAQVSIAPVTLTVAPPASPVEGGTGGCIPRGGNLRVRAVDEQGQPLEGAFVMAGSSVGETFYSDYETVLLGESGDVQNHTLTDADGYAVFQDLGGQLSDPSIMVTAGASGRAYASAQGFDAADMVFVLEALPPPPDRVTLEGGVTPSYASNNTGRIGLALVTQSLTVETLARFDFMEMLEADKTVRVGGDLCMAGTMDLILPGNIHFPDQNHLGCSLTATPP